MWKFQGSTEKEVEFPQTGESLNLRQKTSKSV